MEVVQVDATSNTPIELTKPRLFAFFAMVVGMFMAILDIQIVASSISVIGAGLSASPEELAWVQTSYIMAEVIVIPLTGYLVRLLSTRIAYAIAALGFTIMSFCCSLAWNIESMILFRALQGFFGGALIPTVFATSFTIFNKDQRPYVSIVIGLVASVAPTLGPTIGGYITETISWHFMFILNLIPGIFVTIVVFAFVDFDQPNPALAKNLDIIGIFFLAISLASLQYILEEGTSKGWLDDSLIITLIGITSMGLVIFSIRELTFHNPIIDLRAFKNSNFTVGCIFSFVIGIGLFGAVYLLPLYLYSIAGMNTYDIGLVMIVTGSFQFVSAPFAGHMFKRGIDKRIILAIGVFLFALGCYLNSFLTSESRFADFFLPQAIRGFSLMFCFMPINSIALDSIPPSSLQNASGLYNLTRNLGGALGLALINTYIVNSTKILSSYLGENLSVTSIATQNRVQNIEYLFDGKITNADIASLAMLKSLVSKEAFIISINNAFIIIACIFLSSLLLIVLTKET